MLCNLLNRVENFKELCLEVESIIEKFGQDKTQIICQTLEEGVEDWVTGTGKVSELAVTDETQYKYIQPSIHGSVLESIILKHQAFRTRIMIMPGRSSYSVHKDRTPRIHIPIITNLDSWMIWPFKQHCRRLDAGFAYWTDTTQNHTFLNGSLETRIHLVMCVNSILDTETL